MKKLTTILLLFFTLNSYTQSTELKQVFELVYNMLQKRDNQISQLQEENNGLRFNAIEQQNQIDSLTFKLQQNTLDIASIKAFLESNNTDNDNDTDNNDGTVDGNLPPVPEGLAFATAKGAGAYATGGRGGKVIRVTTLCWDCEGGLKEAIQTPGPRIIVFDVSGEIDATSQLRYSNIINGANWDNITIAGESAPHGGITIRTNEFRFANVDNIIIRYIRFRGTTYTNDTVSFFGNSNVIFDHCTFSFGGDEAASWADSSGEMGNITVQNCLFQDSKTGTILGVDDTAGDFTFINNVFSNISHRFPNPKGDGHYDIINNVVYNWRNRLVRVTGEGTYNILNNYYKGSAKGIHKPGWFSDYTLPATRLHRLQTQASDDPLIYSAGSVIYNVRETPQADDRDMWSVFAGSHLPVDSSVPDQYFTNTMFDLTGHPFEYSTAKEAYNDFVVSGNVGAYKTLNADGSVNIYRDTKDTADLKMIQEDSYNGNHYSGDPRVYPVIPQNSRPANFDSNNDGVPDAYAVKHGFSIITDLSQHRFDNGGVGVEGWLFEIDK